MTICEQFQRFVRGLGINEKQMDELLDRYSRVLKEQRVFVQNSKTTKRFCYTKGVSVYTDEEAELVKETRRKRVIQKQKVQGFLRLGIIGLGLVPFLSVTEDTLVVCLFCLGLTIVVAAVI